MQSLMKQGKCLSNLELSSTSFPSPIKFESNLFSYERQAKTSFSLFCSRLFIAYGFVFVVHVSMNR